MFILNMFPNKKNKPAPFIEIKPNNSTKKCEFEISFPNYLNL